MSTLFSTTVSVLAAGLVSAQSTSTSNPIALVATSDSDSRLQDQPISVNGDSLAIGNGASFVGRFDDTGSLVVDGKESPNYVAVDPSTYQLILASSSDSGFSLSDGYLTYAGSQSFSAVADSNNPGSFNVYVGSVNDGIPFSIRSIPASGVETAAGGVNTFTETAYVTLSSNATSTISYLTTASVQTFYSYSTAYITLTTGTPAVVTSAYTVTSAATPTSTLSSNVTATTILGPPLYFTATTITTGSASSTVTATTTVVSSALTDTAIASNPYLTYAFPGESNATSTTAASSTSGVTPISYTTTTAFVTDSASVSSTAAVPTTAPAINGTAVGAGPMAGYTALTTYTVYNSGSPSVYTSTFTAYGYPAFTVTGSEASALLSASGTGVVIPVGARPAQASGSAASASASSLATSAATSDFAAAGSGAFDPGFGTASLISYPPASAPTSALAGTGVSTDVSGLPLSASGTMPSQVNGVSSKTANGALAFVFGAAAALIAF